MTPTLFQLSIQQFEQICVFELAWGDGQRLQARLVLPHSLMTTYHQWQAAYLDYYKRVHLPLRPIAKAESSSDPALRGRAAGSGTVAPSSIDWGKQLDDAESALSNEFRAWLRRSQDLDALRREIALASRSGDGQTGVNLLITCTPLELARLPWETWDIAADLAIVSKIRISRSVVNIRQPAASVHHPVRRRPRLLAILGDDRGLDFAAEIKALKQALKPLVELVFVGWRPNQRIDDLKDQIGQAIADPRGWDVLFFAGHSNETANGELGIAPGVAIRVSDIASQLVSAKERGLQFALFNSCKGLKIASALIDLGLNQVVIMREPIENRVAQEFLVQFVQELAAHKDVHECTIAACQYLATTKKLTYPSAHLIPSLFRHPNSTLFRLPPRGWRYRLQPWCSKPYQTAALATLVLCSLLPSVQLGLLDQRVLWQARYRQLTQRDVPAQQPPLLLVRIDEESLRRADLIGKEHPLPQGYLAALIQHLSVKGAKVIAIDYVLDSKQPDTPKLVQAVQQARQRDTHLLLATTYDNEGNWHTARPEIAQAANSEPGNAERAWGDDFHLPLQRQDFKQPYPLFADLVAQLHHRYVASVLDSQSPSSRLNLQPLTSFSYGLSQMWLHPIVDFSLRPSQLYHSLSAGELLEQGRALHLPNLPQQTVMIVPGGYATAGWKPGDDSFTAPAAMRHWYLQEHPNAAARQMTGGEHQAYLFHHFLTQRLVLPLPDLWVVLLAALFGKGTSLLWQEQLRQTSKTSSAVKRTGVVLLCSGTTLYTLFCWELYLSSAAILLPIVLPTVLFWVYVLPPILKPQQ